MSVALMASVFNCNMPELKTDDGRTVPDTTSKSVLLALANYANDEGEGSYPSVDDLCHKTNYSTSTICNALNALRTNGFTTLVGRSKYDTNCYTVLLDKVMSLQWPPLPKRKHDSSHRNASVSATETNPLIQDSLRTSQATPEQGYIDWQGSELSVEPVSGNVLEQVSAPAPNVVNIHINAVPVTHSVKIPADWKMAADLPVEPADFIVSREDKMLIAATSMPAYMQETAIWFSKLTKLIPESKRDLSRWRGDLKEIHEKHLTQEQLEDAYNKCAKEGLTVKSPGSLIGVADALRAVAEKKKTEKPAVPVVSEFQAAIAGGFVAPKPIVFSQGASHAAK